MKPSRSHRSRGHVYLLVLGCATLATVIGLSALLTFRVQLRTAEGANDAIEARLYAQAAVEMGLHHAATNSTWRSSKTNGAWETERAIGRGTYTLAGVDPTDGNLADSLFDPLLLTGTGRKGPARHVLEARFTPGLVALEALNTCLHATGPVTTLAGYSITLTGAPVSVNGTLQNNGGIIGSVEALLIVGAGTITGTTTVPAPAKPMPDAGVFDLYRLKATTIPFPGSIIERVVLTPTLNPWGSANADGVYYMNTGSSDVTIRGCRIEGTLVIQCGLGRKVILDDAVSLTRFRSDYPALIVNGGLDLDYSSASYGLSESTWTTNFNPPGSGYAGGVDGDQGDTYANEVQGLIHVTSNLAIKDTAKVQGVVIAGIGASVEANCQIIHDPALYSNPPEGYSTAGPLEIVPGTWRQVVD